MRRGMVVGVLVGVLALVAAGCGGGDDNGGGSASAAPETTAATTQIPASTANTRLRLRTRHLEPAHRQPGRGAVHRVGVRSAAPAQREATRSAVGGAPRAGPAARPAVPEGAGEEARLDMTSGAEVKVEVTNQDTIEHNFTFAEAGAKQDVEGGEDATVTFTAPAAGSYEFFCKYHPSKMRGTVTVT